MKISQVNQNFILFDNGMILTSYHDKDCCEIHYVDFSQIEGQGYEGEEFEESLRGLIYKQDETLTQNDYVANNYSGFEFEENTFVKLIDKKGNIYTLPIYNSNNGYYGYDVFLKLYYRGEEFFPVRIQ